MNVAIAFETQGGWRKEKNAIAVTVLQVKFILFSSLVLLQVLLCWSISYSMVCIFFNSRRPLWPMIPTNYSFCRLDSFCILHFSL